MLAGLKKIKIMAKNSTLSISTAKRWKNELDVERKWMNIVQDGTSGTVARSARNMRGR